jgi:hypothetical protein
MAKNFRTAFRHLVPGWLSEGDGGKVLYSLAVIKDVYVQRLRDGIKSRFPSYAGKSAQRLIGQDRGILRGRTETNEHYAARLRAWRYPRGHRVRGNAFALLEQVTEYFGGCYCYTVDVKGNWHTFNDPNAPTQTEHGTGYAWDWDSAKPGGAGLYTPGDPWARFWLVVDLTTADSTFSEHAAIADPECWRVGDLSTTVGIKGMSPEDGQAIKSLVRSPFTWKPAGTKSEYVIYMTEPGSSPVPDGTWYNRRGRLAASADGFRFARLK